MKKTILIIIVCFVAVLAASIGFQVFTSPDFEGFGRGGSGEPVVTYLDGTEAGAGGEAPPYNWEDHPVYVVGDSLTQGARKEIGKAIDGAIIDAEVGRNMTTGASIIEKWYDERTVPDDAIIVVCLAHNITGASVKDAGRIADMIRPGQSLIMMTGHGRSDMQPVNEFIRSLPNVYPYITVADWDSTVSQSPSLLSDDMVHIARKQGNELYADLILRALESTMPMR